MPFVSGGGAGPPRSAEPPKLAPLPIPPAPPRPPGRGRPVVEDAKVHFNEQDTEIIGILEADLIHLTATSGGVGGELTETTFDTTTHAEGAIIKLTNSTGVSKTVTHCSIRGRLVARLSGKLGFLHDAFNDYERIAVEGERLFELANNYIVTAAQVRKLADYFWKFHRAKRHIYTIDMPGTWHWICPGEVYTLQIGGVGQKEYIDSVCVCMDVQTSRGAKDLGQTTIALQELYQNWVFDSNALSRFIARGCPGGVKSFPYAVVASQYDPGSADYYCDGTADQVEIQAANDYLVGAYGGGTIHLRKGTYNLTAAISLGSNVILEGEGAASIVKKNCNDYAIKAVGTSGTHLTNVGIRDMTITRDAADANDIALTYLNYADNVLVINVVFSDAKYYSVLADHCENLLISECRFLGIASLIELYLTYDNNFRVQGCVFDQQNVARSTAFRYFVWTENSVGGKIQNNIFKRVRNTDVTYALTVIAISTTCPATVVSRNEVYDIQTVSVQFVYVAGDDAIIENNVFHACGVLGAWTSLGNCIYVAYQVQRTIIRNNLVDDSWSRAIYLHTTTGTMICGNTVRNCGDLMLRGACESATDPWLAGETSNTETNCTFARSADFKRNGTYSRKFTKVANANFMYFHDALFKTDLVGLVAGCSYTLSMWVWVPSAVGSPLGTEIFIGIKDVIDPAPWVPTEVAAADLYDQWQLVTVTLSLRAMATGAGVYVRCLDAATDGEIFYVDDIRLRPDGVHNEFGKALTELDTVRTVQTQNTWQAPFVS